MTLQKKAKNKKNKKISANEFDGRFERGDDLTDFLDFEHAVVVKRVNVDFPMWMIAMLDQEALKLNVSRQAIIKMWIDDRLKASKKASM